MTDLRPTLPEPVETGALVAGLKSLSASFEIRAQNMRGDPECVYEDSALCKEAASRIEALEAENARLRRACEALLDQAPIDSDLGYCGWCSNGRGHEADCAVALARAALGSEKK